MQRSRLGPGRPAIPDEQLWHECDRSLPRPIRCEHHLEQGSHRGRIHQVRRSRGMQEQQGRRAHRQGRPQHLGIGRKAAPIEPRRDPGRERPKTSRVHVVRKPRHPDALPQEGDVEVEVVQQTARPHHVDKSAPLLGIAEKVGRQLREHDGVEEPAQQQHRQPIRAVRHARQVLPREDARSESRFAVAGPVCRGGFRHVRSGARMESGSTAIPACPERQQRRHSNVRRPRFARSLTVSETVWYSVGGVGRACRQPLR